MFSTDPANRGQYIAASASSPTSSTRTEDVHIRDLRHTGNQLVANAGANPKELMARMGHDSERAAMIYLHSSRKRQRALADAVGEAARGELAKSKARTARESSGTQRARNRGPGPASSV